MNITQRNTVKLFGNAKYRQRIFERGKLTQDHVPRTLPLRNLFPFTLKPLF